MCLHDTSTQIPQHPCWRIHPSQCHTPKESQSSPTLAVTQPYANRSVNVSVSFSSLGTFEASLSSEPICSMLVTVLISVTKHTREATWGTTLAAVKILLRVVAQSVSSSSHCNRSGSRALRLKAGVGIACNICPLWQPSPGSQRICNSLTAPFGI